MVDIFDPILRRKQLLSMLLVYAGLIFWLGGLAFFGFGVAGTIFKHLSSRDLAGNLNGIILGKLSTMEFVSAVLLLGGLLVYNLKLSKIWAKIPIGIAGVMLVLAFVYGVVIRSSMDDVKSQIGSFDNPAAQDLELKAEFDGYHKLYSRLVGINMGLGLTIFIWQTLIFAYPERFTKTTAHAQDTGVPGPPPLFDDPTDIQTDDERA